MSNFIQINLRYKNIIHKILWVKEDAYGIYFGYFGGQLDGLHFSYHKNGISHVRRGKDKKNLQPNIKNTPINDVDLFMPLPSQAIPLNKQNTELIGSENFNKRQKRKILLNSDDCYHKNQITVNFFLVKKDKRKQFLSSAQKMRQTDNSQWKVIKRKFVDLDFFPKHELALIFLSEMNRENTTPKKIFKNNKQPKKRPRLKLGIIKEGKLKGRKIILEPRDNLKENEWLVEKVIPTKTTPIFHKACLIHEIFIPDNGCPKCIRRDVS